MSATEHVCKPAAGADRPQRPGLRETFGDTRKSWARATARLRRELFLGREPRECARRVAKKRGKSQVFIIPGIVDKVIGRVVDRRLREVGSAHIPVESMGLLEGTSVQKALQGIANHLRLHPDDHVVVGDVSRCHESIRPGVAIRQFETWGADPWSLRWLRQFYRRNRGNISGLGRGLAWSPLLAAATLLPVFTQLRAHAKHVVWVGDDFLAFCEPANAVTAWNAFEKALKEANLQPSDKKRYVGPITGRWSFAGYVFNDGIAAPKPASIERLHAKVAQHAPADLEKACQVIDGWCPQYVPTRSSLETAAASEEIEDKYGKELPNLVRVMTQIAARTSSDDVPLPGDSAGVSTSTSQAPPSRVPPSSLAFLPTGESPPNSAAIAATEPHTRGAGARPAPPPEALLDHQRRPDPLNLRWRPELFPVLRRGGLYSLALSSGLNFMLYAEAIAENLRDHPFRTLGYVDAESYVQRHLGQTMDEIRRLVAVARCAEEFAWGDPDDEVDPPIGALRAMLHITSTRPWATDVRAFLLSLLADGEISTRAFKAALRRSLARARRIARRFPHRNRPPGQRAQTSVRLRDGRTFILKDGGLGTRWRPRLHGPPARANRSRYGYAVGRRGRPT